MFSVNTINKCGCGNVCSNYCIVKCCINCCVAKTCTKHTKKISCDNICDICSHYNEKETMNNYLLLKNNTLVHYCNECYDTHIDLLNYLIIKSAEKEQYDNFIIKYKHSDNALQRYNEEVEKYNASILYKSIKKEKENELELIDEIVDEFLEQYKNIVITEDILNNEIKTHKYYKYFDLINNSDYKYECPFCNKIVFFDETSRCESCVRISCNHCEIIKTIDCSNRNCSYCRSGNCYNNQIERYCTDCYVDNNLEFYKKYKDTIITSTILQTEINTLKIDEIEQYNLEYKCNICLITTALNSYCIRCCDRCDEYICSNCSIIKNNGCANYYCRFCNQGTCRYATSDIICNNCYRNDNDDSDEDDNSINQIIRCSSPSIPAVEGEAECNICYINVKKYACVPCGHMCMCGECANRIVDKCPICKDNINNIIKIYL